MNKTQHRYKTSEGQLCLCSRPAVAIRNNLPVCAKCMELENHRYSDSRPNTKSPNAKYAEHFFTPDAGHKKSYGSGI